MVTVDPDIFVPINVYKLEFKVILHQKSLRFWSTDPETVLALTLDDSN